MVPGECEVCGATTEVLVVKNGYMDYELRDCVMCADCIVEELQTNEQLFWLVPGYETILGQLADAGFIIPSRIVADD